MADVRTQTIEFPADGETGHAFLALPEGAGPFPGVIVVQEWWGLVDHIKDVARRFADEGFAALAPDLYHGKVTREPNEAQKLMMSLNMGKASAELTKAADYLASRPEVAGHGIGAIGFCMGGSLALTLACDSPQIRAAAPFYGGNPSPLEKVANLRGPVFAAYAENDGWVTVEVREQLDQALSQHGIAHELKVYPGTEHAFFNDTRAEVYNRGAANDAWQRATSLFRDNL